jgi:hypothetical protein
MDMKKLSVDLSEFNYALRAFKKRRQLSEEALLSFDEGILCIESGEVTVTMHASGDWDGSAEFSSALIKALAQVPLGTNPVVITYEEGTLHIGTMKIPCHWRERDAAILNRMENPSTIDLLALDRSLPRHEIHGSGLARRISEAKANLPKQVAKAAKLLADLEISEAALMDLVEQRVSSRLRRDGEPSDRS